MSHPHRVRVRKNSSGRQNCEKRRWEKFCRSSVVIQVSYREEEKVLSENMWKLKENLFVFGRHDDKVS
jgi:hypothetical protein